MTGPGRARSQRGYAMAALLVGMAVMAVVLSVAMPAWSTLSRREKESELIFRGQQYARAVTLFQRRFPGQFPPNLNVLLDGRYLRKRYRDPMTADGEFQLVLVGQPVPGQAATPAAPGAGAARGVQPGQQPGRGGAVFQPAQPGGQTGIMGVVSKSTGDALRIYNGRQKYNEWAFVAVQATTQGGTGAGRGVQAPGAPGRGAQPPQQPGRLGLPPLPPGGRGPAFPGRGGQPQQPPLFPQQPGRGRVGVP